MISFLRFLGVRKNAGRSLIRDQNWNLDLPKFQMRWRVLTNGNGGFLSVYTCPNNIIIIKLINISGVFLLGNFQLFEFPTKREENMFGLMLSL